MRWFKFAKASSSICTISLPARMLVIVDKHLINACNHHPYIVCLQSVYIYKEALQCVQTIVGHKQRRRQVGHSVLVQVAGCEAAYRTFKTRCNKLIKQNICVVLVKTNLIQSLMDKRTHVLSNMSNRLNGLMVYELNLIVCIYTLCVHI